KREAASRLRTLSAAEATIHRTRSLFTSASEKRSRSTASRSAGQRERSNPGRRSRPIGHSSSSKANHNSNHTPLCPVPIRTARVRPAARRFFRCHAVHLPNKEGATLLPPYLNALSDRNPHPRQCALHLRWTQSSGIVLNEQLIQRRGHLQLLNTVNRIRRGKA